MTKCIEMAPKKTRKTSRTSRDLARLGILRCTPGAGPEVARDIMRGGGRSGGASGDGEWMRSRYCMINNK